MDLCPFPFADADYRGSVGVILFNHTDDAFESA